MADDVRDVNKLSLEKSHLVEVIEERLAVIEAQREVYSDAVDARFTELMDIVRADVKEGKLQFGDEIVSDTTTFRHLADFALRVSDKMRVLENSKNRLETRRRFLQAARDEVVEMTDHEYQALMDIPDEVSPDELWERVKNRRH